MAHPAASAGPHVVRRPARRPSSDRLLDQVESVSRVGSYSVDLVAGSWTSSKVLDTIFGIDAGFDRSVDGWASLIHPADREMMVAYFAEEVVGRVQAFDREYRIARADTGEERWVHGRGVLDLDDTGRPVRMLGTIADITDQRAAQEALIRSELRYAAIFEGTAEAILIADLDTGRFRWVNPAACAMLGYERDELLALTVRDIHLASDLADVLGRFETVEDGRLRESDSVRCVRKDGTVLLADIRSNRAMVDGSACNVAFFTDVTKLRRLETEDRQLATAVEQTSDSVMIVDLTGTIQYVNPAFERASGFRRDEAVGQNPRILKSGRQSAAFYRALWRRLVRGQSWSGTLVNRRKDGALYEEEATISPLRAPGGEVTGYVAVKRDVTALRAAEASLAREFRERAGVAAALSRLKRGPNAAETAADICDALLGLPGIDVATLVSFEGPRRAVTIAARGPAGLPMVPGRPLPAGRAAYLYERATQGPWAQDWHLRTVDGAYGKAMSDVGIQAMAYAPIRDADRLLGLVAAGTLDEDYARHLIDHLPAVGEFAVAAGALVIGQLEGGRRDTQLRARIQRVLIEHGYHPVFQPIVTLQGGERVGYEALTRFADGTPPDRMIADAHTVGLGAELEVACLSAALDAAASLSPDLWLNLNASPDVIQHSPALAELITGRSRRIVIEVTEHAAIDDYQGVRDAVAGFGPLVSLAVDDAGAGFASLRHLTELTPRFLKLDISLVRHVDRELSRQAMIAGLSHFAGRVGCEVIAEGIEDVAELETLSELGVHIGQGFLLGRPEPLPGTRAVSARRFGQGKPATTMSTVARPAAR